MRLNITDGIVVQRDAVPKRHWVHASSESAMSTAKQDVELLLNKLPDDCSVEDIQYHLYVLDKVRRGLEDAQVNGTISQDEVEARLSKWLSL
jgi:hypothetical protein